MSELPSLDKEGQGWLDPVLLEASKTSSALSGCTFSLIYLWQDICSRTKSAILPAFINWLFTNPLYALFPEPAAIVRAAHKHKLV